MRTWLLLEFFFLRALLCCFLSLESLYLYFFLHHDCFVISNNSLSVFLWKQQLFGTFQDRHYIYFALEYVPGGELFHRLGKKKVCSYPFIPPRVSEYRIEEIVSGGVLIYGSSYVCICRVLYLTDACSLYVSSVMIIVALLVTGIPFHSSVQCTLHVFYSNAHMAVVNCDILLTQCVFLFLFLFPRHSHPRSPNSTLLRYIYLLHHTGVWFITAGMFDVLCIVLLINRSSKLM